MGPAGARGPPRLGGVLTASDDVLATLIYNLINRQVRLDKPHISIFRGFLFFFFPSFFLMSQSPGFLNRYIP